MVDKENDLPYSGYPLSEYNRGAIVTLVLENFMKHRDGNFRFTPGLNFIFGLNGSGKSSLVCALILGHGGEPNITGRCSKVSQYITRGATKASIKIELSNGDAKTTTILERKLILNTDSNNVTNEYRIDRKRTTLEDFKEVVANFNIKVDNLCQVLPQERVSFFSKLNREQLLLSTEQSIGDVKLFKDHEYLIDSDKKIITLEKDKKAALEEIKFVTGIINTLKVNVEKIHESEKFEKEIDLLEKKIIFMKFNNARETFVRVKDNFQRHKDELKDLKKKSDEFKKQFNKMDNIISKYEEKIDIQKKNMSTYEGFCSKLEGSNRDYRNEKKRIISDYRENALNLNRETLKLKDITEEVEREKERLEQLSQKNENVEEELKSINKKIHDLDGSMVSESILESQRDKIRIEKARAERFINSDGERRKNVLKSVLKPSTQRANELFYAHKEEFKGLAYNALITHFRPKAKEFVKYFERAIGSNDWEMFLFERAEDLNFFRDILIKEHCKVPMALAPDLRNENMDTNPNISQLRSYGVLGSLNDILEAPDLVRAYLNKTAHLNQHPYGNSDAAKNYEIISRKFTKLFTPEKYYGFISSKYSAGVVSTTVEDWKPEKAMARLMDFDKGLLQKYKEIIQRSDNELAQVQMEIEEQRANNKKLEAELCALKAQKVDLEKCFRAKENYQRTLDQKLREQKSIEKKIESLKKISSSNEKKKMDDLISKHESMIKTFVSVLTKNSDNVKERFIVSYEHSIVEPLRDHFRSQHYNEDRRLKERENELQSAQVQMNKAKQDASKYLNEACERTQLPLKDGNDPRVKELLASFDKCPETEAEILASISVFKQKCDSFRGVNKKTVDEHQSYIEKKLAKEEKIAEMDEEVKNIQANISKIKDGWASRLKIIVEKIDANFSKFMKKLGYQGSVKLALNDNFALCGIDIRVKFRDNAELCDLQSQAQSGGERSVATVVYMLALQEQAVVPFRIIDEINQGMDANNERNVFGLFDYVAQSNKSQYFLLTPKIISGLEYTPQMSVVNILAMGKHAC